MKHAPTCLVLCAVPSTRSIQLKPQGHVMAAVCENGETEAQRSHAVFKSICYQEVTGWDLNPRSLLQVCVSNHYALLTFMYDRGYVPGSFFLE